MTTTKYFAGRSPRPRGRGGSTVDGNAPTRCKPKRPKPTRRLPPEVLRHDEVLALMAACGDACGGRCAYPVTSARNRALIALLYRTGLRVSEALHLRPKDLDLDAGAVRVLRGKGGTWRTVGLDAGAAAVLRVWLADRARLAVNGQHPVFCTLRGTPLTTAYVRRLLPRLARIAGIEKRVHAHGLRHTHAAQLREEGIDIAIISRQLGHASIATTVRYLDHLAPTAVVEALRGRVW